jgi:hypothetical protein
VTYQDRKLSADLSACVALPPRVIQAGSCARLRNVTTAGGVAVFEAVGNFSFGEMLPPFSLSEQMPTIERTVRGLLAVERRKSAISRNFFHGDLPSMCFVQAYSRSLRQSHYDYETELFLNSSAGRHKAERAIDRVLAPKRLRLVPPKRPVYWILP